MEFRTEIKGEYWVIRPKRGELKDETIEGFKEQVSGALDVGQKKIIVDFVEIDFINSKCLGVLIGLYKKANLLKRKIIIASPSSQISRLFRLTQLDKIFVIKQSLQEISGINSTTTTIVVGEPTQN